jgi:hypothetical protein
MVKCEKWIKVPAEAKTAETESSVSIIGGADGVPEGTEILGDEEILS